MGTLLPDRHQLRRLFQSKEGTIGTILVILGGIKPMIQLLRLGVGFVGEIQTTAEIWPFVQAGALWAYNSLRTWLNPLVMVGGVGLILHSLRRTEVLSDRFDSSALATTKPSTLIEAAKSPLTVFPIELKGSPLHAISADDYGGFIPVRNDSTFRSVAWLATFANTDSKSHTISARVLYYRTRREGREIFQTLNLPVWLMGLASGLVSLEANEVRDLVLAIQHIDKPLEWFSLEDNRLTDYSHLGIEQHSLPPVKTSIEVELQLDHDQKKSFHFSVNFKTFSSVKLPKEIS